ncbi:MAG: hypothetical protein AB1861_07715 [Cyanobacteriota bacterium]
MAIAQYIDPRQDASAVAELTQKIAGCNLIPLLHSNYNDQVSSLDIIKAWQSEYQLRTSLELV